MILVDAHVHIYDCFDLGLFLDSAFANFESEASRRGRKDSYSGILLLTETSSDNWFRRFSGFAENKGTVGNWTFHKTKEDCSLWLQRNASQGMYLISGRQIITAKNLEVLALMTYREFRDGQPLLEVLQTIKESGAIPVIPWGVGKWTGYRKKILKNTLEMNHDNLFFLGDNGGRAAFWPRPTLFEFAEERGIRVLPGSDPLPFAAECRRAGSYGFSVDGALSPNYPGRHLRRLLMDGQKSPRTYGRLESPITFIGRQAWCWISRQFDPKKSCN